jgi:hypothetical protein
VILIYLGAPDPYALDDEDIVVVNRDEVEHPSRGGSRHSGSRHSGQESARRVSSLLPAAALTELIITVTVKPRRTP